MKLYKIKYLKQLKECGTMKLKINHINRAKLDLQRGQSFASIYSDLRKQGLDIKAPELRTALYSETISVIPDTELVSQDTQDTIRPKKAGRPKKETKLIKDSYDIAESKNPEKIEINRALAQMIQKYRLQSREMIVLESPALLTVKELKKVGVSETKIHIPNHTDSFATIKRKHGNTYALTLGEYLSWRFKTKYGFIFADYCGTLDGNITFSPLWDIKTIMENKMLCDGAVLGVTISKRNSKKPNDFKNNDISRLGNANTSSAHQNGYVAVELDCGRSYNGKMYFTAYQVFRK